jgi:hypothetical protein
MTFISAKYLRELIRELAEDGMSREELTAFVDEAIRLSYEDPSKALEISYQDLDELERMP